MKRIKAIREIMKKVKDELVVTSPGMISREVYWVKDRPENFYVLGTMGAALGIGIGLALFLERKVIVIIGDGDALINLGSLVLMNKLKLKNLELIILDNNSYQSCGGQPSCSDAIDFKKICKCKVIRVSESDFQVPRIPLKPEEIMRRFYNVINRA